jgi:cyclase
MRLAENVYAVLDLAHPIGVNAGFVVTHGGVVVIDSGLTHSSALTILGYIQAAAPDSPIRYVILTEHHSDHIFGAHVFKARGAEIMAHKLTREFLESQGRDYVQARITETPGGPEFGDTFYRNVELALPDRTIDGPTDLLAGNELLKLIPTPGHLADCISVYLPQKKILFAGDTIYSGYPPTTKFGDERLWSEWITSLERLKQLDVETIVPGHGPVCGKSEIDRNIEYLARLLQARSSPGDQGNRTEATT